MNLLLLSIATAALLAGCAGSPMGPSTPPAAVDPERATMSVTCGSDAFPAELLHGDGRAEEADHPAAAELRRLLASPEASGFLPPTGWRVAVQEEERAVFIADAPPGSDPPFVEATIELTDGTWRTAGYGQCRPVADVGPGLGLAAFRVAPGVELSADLTRINVLVTERACNSGQDARGRIIPPAVILTADTVTVVFGVTPRDGAHACPSNPETPFVLELPEPLGDRALLDGSSVPARDATTCPDIAACPAS